MVRFKLKGLDLSHNKITAVGANTLAKVWKSNESQLKTLDLQNNNINLWSTLLDSFRDIMRSKKTDERMDLYLFNNPNDEKPISDDVKAADKALNIHYNFVNKK